MLTTAHLTAVMMSLSPNLPLPAAALAYSTYLGGNGNDRGYGIAIDSSGCAYVTGYTASSNFPTANPYQATIGRK